MSKFAFHTRQSSHPDAELGSAENGHPISVTPKGAIFKAKPTRGQIFSFLEDLCSAHPLRKWKSTKNTHTQNTKHTQQSIYQRLSCCGGLKNHFQHTIEIWLILPVVICLFQGLSHACLRITALQESAHGSLHQTQSAAKMLRFPQKWITWRNAKLIHESLWASSTHAALSSGLVVARRLANE